MALRMHVGFYERACWQVSHVLSPFLFYQALPCVLKEGSVIFLSSYVPLDESVTFLNKHQAPEHLIEPVALYASSEPASWSAHCLYTQAMQKDLEAYFADWNTPIADNIVCYRQGELLLWFHDAFTGGVLQLSSGYDQNQITTFCTAMRPTFQFVEASEV